MFGAKAKGCANGGDRGGGAVSTRNVCECEACRAGPVHDAIERVCRESDARDPVELALAILRRPEVKLHGFEHRYAVAGALVAAYANVRGAAAEKARWLADARRAIEAAPGDACPCDVRKDASVAHATGVFVATVKADAGLAKQVGAASAKLASQVKGAPCCKRNAFLAILQACHFTREHLGTELHARGPACEWYPQNKACIQAACPFYRVN
ncbi:MAG TPA: DUF5714 domain-containing protein [Anaeromyxobacteraceae bacterium]|nr:DUF5714 domain-containing protein [Anaeromyxobacteraceae bacterium]